MRKRGYKVSYQPNIEEFERIDAERPIDAAFAFFKLKKENGVIFVEKNALRVFDFNPVQFIDEYPDALNFIEENCPQALSDSKLKKPQSILEEKESYGHDKNYLTKTGDMVADGFKFEKGAIILWVVVIAVFIIIGVAFFYFKGLPS